MFGTSERLTVPLVAAIRINGQYFVFLAEGDAQATVARQRAVTLGRVIGNEYLVVAGLNAGERLVVSGIQKIADGVPITPMPPSAAAPGPAGAAGRGQ